MNGILALILGSILARVRIIVIDLNPLCEDRPGRRRMVVNHLRIEGWRIEYPRDPIGYKYQRIIAVHPLDRILPRLSDMFKEQFLLAAADDGLYVGETTFAALAQRNVEELEMEAA